MHVLLVPLSQKVDSFNFSRRTIRFRITGHFETCILLQGQMYPHIYAIYAPKVQNFTPFALYSKLC